MADDELAAVRNAGRITPGDSRRSLRERACFRGADSVDPAFLRSIRRDISDECGGDPDRVFDYYENVQKRIKESGRSEFVNEPIRGTMSSCECAKQIE